MSELQIKFSVTPQHGPMWDAYDKDGLVAYARRSKTGDWAIRVNRLNAEYLDDRIYIDKDADPVGVMKTLIALHYKEN